MEKLEDLQLAHLSMEDPTFSENPWPHFAAAREQHPWLASCSFGYVVCEYQAMRDLLWQDDNMEEALGDIVDIMGARGTNWGRFEGEMLSSRPAMDHKRIRDVLAPAFTPRQAERHRSLMRDVITDLLDTWAPKGNIDFEEFASYFPISVMCGLIGAPTSELPRLRSSLEAFGLCMSMDRNHLPALENAMNVLDGFIQELVAERRRNVLSSNEEDLLSILVRTVDNGKISERELYDLLIFLFVAGYDTSKNALTILMSILIDQPTIYKRCSDDMPYCRRVVEEGFRYFTTSTIPRKTTKDIIYRDVLIPYGTMVFFPVSIAGRDPDAFSRPERFDPDRSDARRHLAFGMGKHICLGQFIARAQLQEGLHQITQRMRNPRRTGASGWRPFYGIWGLRGLPIEFDQAT